MATLSSVLAWEIMWTEEPGGLPSMGSQRVVTTEGLSAHTHTHTHTQCTHTPTPTPTHVQNTFYMLFLNQGVLKSSCNR